jgi:preprotein translocase subunit SecE
VRRGPEGRFDEMAQTSAKVVKPSVFARLARYFNDVKAEMRRVVWPNRKEILNSSWVVVITLAIFIVLIFLLDSVASWIIQGLARSVG